MPARLSKEDRLQRLVAKTRKRVDENPDATRSLSHSPDSRLGVLVREAGYQRISLKFLEELDKRLRDVGIDTFPELTDPDNDRTTRIYFFDCKKQAQGFQQPRQLFAEEKQLSRFLWMNRAVLPYVTKNSLRISGHEVRIADNCVIDLLAEDKKTGELVGFELKAAEADDRLVGQAAKYMKALARRAKSEGRIASRGVVDFGSDVVYASLSTSHGER